MNLKEQIVQLSSQAIATKKDTCLEFNTTGGYMSLTLTPAGRVEILWRDRAGIKEGWFMKDWTVETTLKKLDGLLRS